MFYLASLVVGSLVLSHRLAAKISFIFAFILFENIWEKTSERQFLCEQDLSHFLEDRSHFKFLPT